MNFQPPTHKICPQCRFVSDVSALACANCGRVFQSTRPQANNQTQAFTPQTGPPNAPTQYPQAPPNFGQYQQPYGYIPQQVGITQFPPGAYSPILAILLSVFLSGWIGMLVNRQTAKGLCFLLCSIVFTFVTCGNGLLIVYILGIIDVVCIGNRLARGEPVRDWQWF